MNKCFCLGVFILIYCYAAFAQNSDTTEMRNKHAEKKWTLTFRADLSQRPTLYAKSARSYDGEFYGINNSSGNFEWVRKSETVKKDFTDGTFNNRAFQLSVLLSPANIKGLNIGLSYNLLTFSGQTEIFDSMPNVTFTYYEEAVFFAIGGIVDYTYEFDKPKNLFVAASLGLGAYQSDALYSGKGKELMTDTRLAVGYFVGGRFGIRTYIAHNYALYRQTEDSEFFSGQQNKVKFDLNHAQFGIGISYRFFLVPD